MTFDQLKAKHQTIQTLINAINNEELNVLSKFLYNRISQPDSYVTMLGETSSGKSTLINGLLKRQLLKTSSAPTTGTIVEVMFEPQISSPEYYAINKNATMEVLNDQTFDALSLNPDSALSRLRLKVPSNIDNAGLHLFDTPGYGSIIDEHEEILKDFIPNSDVIIYVIGYKIGIQENDFQFMRYIQELINEDSEVIVVVNRCPTNVSSKDRRIVEIKEYADDLFHKNVPIFTVGSETSNSLGALPEAQNLWNHIKKIVLSEERQSKLITTFDLYLDDLFEKANKIIEKQELELATSKKEKEDLEKIAKELRVKGNKIIDTEIIPTFDRLINSVPLFFEKAHESIAEKISLDIDNEPTGRMDETISFVNNHSLPMQIGYETKEFEHRVLVEMDAMNERVNNYLNEAIADYYQEVELCFSTNLELAARASGGKVAGKLLENGLTRYFASFGGAGGAGAGVANAAKHLLKKTGNLFGKTFSRETHNALAHALKKIGATSAKAIGYAVIVIIEIAQIVIDYSTWKYKLKKQVNKGLVVWQENTVKTVQEDLTDLKNKNIETLKSIINAHASAYEFEENTIIDNVSELVKLRNKIKTKLENKEYE